MSKFNEWFTGLPEGEQKVLREDKWMLAVRAFEEGVKQGTPKIKVNLVESERGWGSKIDDTKEFDTMELAEKFVEEFNAKNTESTTPDWYMYAEIVG